ncbi:MAG: MopE-related protein [Myxococcales bacterium]
MGANNFKIRAHVIGFSTTDATLNAIAAAGGTTTAYSVSDEATLSTALASIVAGAIKPEVCDNADNNCNGCVDEGFTHYCNTSQPCCSWANPAQRTTCFNNYWATITASNPKGDRTKLPCTAVADFLSSSTWLCYDPGDQCDNLDNNCVNGADEGSTKCGSPLHCPQTEVCNGLDDDCDGLGDEGNVCGSTCLVTPSAEVCDGCDNDCDGVADNGLSLSLPCGYSGPGEPSYCAGTITCKPSTSVVKGGCSASGGLSACTFPAPGPSAEACNTMDDDCNGIADDNVTAVACVPAGSPAGLVYFDGAHPNSTCKMGTTLCVNGATQCQGWVGPSAETCDALDNDCNGQVDDALSGLGKPCGQSVGECKPGVTACMSGAIVCTGTVPPVPEVCDGKDNDCDGATDQGVLADAPAPGLNGCWQNSGTCCHFGAMGWCPPPGGACHGAGLLSAPCQPGVLACQAGQWLCLNARPPEPEACDAVDNDCDGWVDLGVAGDSSPCSSNVGECRTGTTSCSAGHTVCSGVLPTVEVCDGKDNDCDGETDEAVAAGAPCAMPYDSALFSGKRDGLPCRMGSLTCQGAAGLVCMGGVAPQPELCDGIDNDCDGRIDEPGAEPNGSDGSANPQDPLQTLGEVCRTGATPWSWTCVNGAFVCLGTGTPEVCDCVDNDQDGNIDNALPGNPPVCGTGRECVRFAASCQCAEPCGDGAYPCPSGQACLEVVSSETGAAAGQRCVANPCAGGCASKTVTDAEGKVLCAPAGAVAPDERCATPPVCACKAENGCQPPCAGVSCQAGTVCLQSGARAGTCVADNCYEVPCPGCDRVCHDGACVADPCSPNPCGAIEECHPTADFTGHTCSRPCSQVTCGAGQTCVQGQCLDGCVPACDQGQVCDLSKAPPQCVENKCPASGKCSDGSCCEPLTGSCGDCPCTGVVCPDGQACEKGTCRPHPADAGTADASNPSLADASAQPDAGAATAPTGCGCSAGELSGRGTVGPARSRAVRRPAPALVAARPRRSRWIGGVPGDDGAVGSRLLH